MSAFSSLFSGAPKDSSVDSLFGHSAGPVDRDTLKSSRTVIEIPEESEKKRKARKPRKEKKEEKIEKEEEEEEEIEEERQIKKQKKEKKKSKKSEEEDEDLESKYYSKLLDEEDKVKQKKEAEAEVSDETKESSAEAENKKEDKDAEESDSDSSDEEEVPKKAKTTAAKTVDLKEEELDKAERTVFVGNVPTGVITDKKVYKAFKKLFSEVGGIQAIRFRSIAFDEALPRKLAFAKKALHSLRDTVNAYIVFKEREPSRKTCGKFNTTIFENHHLRVDHVAHPAPKDNKRTIFVGNLDFEEREENLWRYFNQHTGDDVESVRVVRDSKTNVGKGFALVQFKDTLSVNKALMLHDKPMVVADAPEPAEGEKKKKPRKLRISRAKANAKPSEMSPNHIDNIRKQKKPKARLSDEQKTKLGRARTLLGKSDRSSAGSIVIEGARATKGQKIAGIKGLKGAKGKVKKPRITDRSTRFKKDKQAMSKLGAKKDTTKASKK